MRIVPDFVFHTGFPADEDSVFPPVLLSHDDYCKTGGYCEYARVVHWSILCSSWHHKHWLYQEHLSISFFTATALEILVLTAGRLRFNLQ